MPATVARSHQLHAAEWANMGLSTTGIGKQKFTVGSRRQRGPAVIMLGLVADRGDGFDAGARYSLCSKRGGRGTAANEDPAFHMDLRRKPVLSSPSPGRTGELPRLC